MRNTKKSLQRLPEIHEEGRKKNNSVWKPQEDSESIKEINGVSFCSVSGKIKTDISTRFSNGGALLSIMKAPSIQGEPVPD